jgi:predicted homoserine dehydrogenase-like protein
MPAADSLAANALPIGLAHRVKLVRDLGVGAVVRWADVAVDERDEAVRVRHDMEAMFRAKAPARATAAE